MKILIGQRTNVDPELKMSIKLAEVCCLPPESRTPTSYADHLPCPKCHNPLICTLSEEAETGEVWLGGPDDCPTCGHRFIDENIKLEPLSQEDIQNLFGTF